MDQLHICKNYKAVKRDRQTELKETHKFIYFVHLPESDRDIINPYKSLRF